MAYTDNSLVTKMLKQIWLFQDSTGISVGVNKNCSFN